ncbi:MAG: hypothetical protein EBS07_09415 [Sphingobacteriia bacterium]|nr:hypothetical protein [Sphingobacteriia bacterium]
MNLKYYWIFLWVGFANAVLMAQPLNNAWESKNIGIYFSKKNFQYSDDWKQWLNQWVMQSSDVNLPRQELKLAVLVEMGNQLENGLKVTQAHSVQFLNSIPEKSNEWSQFLLTGKRPGTWLDSLDYVLTLDSFTLSAYPVLSVYSVSNQLVNDKRWVYTLKTKGLLYSPSTSGVYRNTKIHFQTNSDITQAQPKWLNLDHANAPGAQQLAVFWEKMLEEINWK